LLAYTFDAGGKQGRVCYVLFMLGVSASGGICC
jgi:hypothetical protein